MKKINYKAEMEEEVYIVMNKLEDEDDLRPYWEEEVYEYDDPYEDDFFFQKQADDYYNKYIKGHTYEEISSSEVLSSHYAMWSDLFKDAYGFRPRWV